MKLIFTLILFTLCFTVNAQNWKTVATGDTTYFRGGLHISDYVITPEYSSILKMIFIDSVSISNGDTTFHFYRSVRGIDMNQCLDTIAPTWLGTMFIHADNGNEYYFNSFGDTITIKTQAVSGDTWVLALDTSNLTFAATLIASGQIIVEGVADSFKRVTIQAFQNGNPVSNPYNGKLLEWSKNHGWLTTLDLYRFPNQINGWEEFGAVTDSVQLVRLDNDFAHRDLNYIDFQWKYTPGNEWIYHSESGSILYGTVPYNGAYKQIIHDSVISSTILNIDTILVTFQTKSYSVDGWQHPTNTNPFWDSTVTTGITFHTDTITNNSGLIIVDTIEPELLYQGMTYTLNNNSSELFTRYFSDTICDRVTLSNYFEAFTHLEFDNCWIIGPSLSGGAQGSQEYLYGFGRLRRFYRSGEILQSPQSYYKNYHSYLKLGSCTYGTKIDVIALSTKNVTNQVRSINIHPNPAKDYVTVQSSVTDENAVITLMDMTGRTLLEQHGLKQANQINVSGFSAGIYLVNIATAHGSNTYRLVISN